MLDYEWNTILVRPGEFMVRLGSWSRKYMFRRLEESIEKRLTREGFTPKVVGIEPRIIIYEPKPTPKVLGILKHVFGISSYSPAICVDFTFNDLFNVLESMVSISGIDSIAIRIHRGDTRISSRGLIRELSDRLSRISGVRIDLERPDLEVNIEIRNDKAFIYTYEIPGPSGLPYGVEGCLVSLVSGGVDSAVASVLAMKRGIKIVPLFANLHPYWSRKAIERAYRSFELIFRWVPWDSMKAYIIKDAYKPLLSLKVPANIRCIACKAIMHRYASKLAQRLRCHGIVTGEAVGQVASQTLNNMSALTMLSPLPIYRPVAFMDKLEIIEIGRKMGLSQLNISVGECRLRPRHPSISITVEELSLLKSELERIDDLITGVLDNNLEEIVFPR
ncbi:MAG: tRNA sulfurtransferase [Crenarchaeota archaeon]|nr:tRNA sulfurtransferase [Thermoproteota archaeon]